MYSPLQNFFNFFPDKCIKFVFTILYVAVVSVSLITNEG